MDDPIQELGNVTTELTDEAKARLEAEISSLDVSKNFYGEESEEPETPEQPQVSPEPTGTEQAEQPVEQSTEQPQAEQPAEPEEQQWMWDKGYDAGDSLRQIGESALFLPTGAIDFATDLINLVPGVGIPKLPKFKTDVLQSARELSSFIVPNVVGIGVAGNAARGLAAASKWKAASGTVARFFGNTSLAAGVGAFVDSTNKLNEKDDNLQGSLKKMFPETFQWISDDWATLDSDTPDVKRLKNVYEGIGLGIFTDLLLGSAKLLSAVRGTKKITRIIPDSEKSTAYFAKNTDAAPVDAEDAFVQSAASREEALDNLGEWNITNSAGDLDTPMKGVHDVFDYDEIGTRSQDPLGVHGAAIDAARIQGNRSTTYGRLGSLITDAALKYGIKAENLTKRMIVKYIANEIKQGGKYSVELAQGGKLSWDEIDKAGTNLAAYITDPSMDPSMVRGILDEFKNSYKDLNVQALGNVGYNAAMKSIRQYLDEYMNIDTLKAQAYLTTSMGGQISDIAEGARIMEGTNAVAAAREMIRDRIKYLMVEKGLASYQLAAGTALLKVWKEQPTSKALKAAAQNAKEGTDAQLKEIISRAERLDNTLKTLGEERPEFLDPFIMAYEYSDGNVDTLSKLNRYFEESLPNFASKALFDSNPEIPNQLVQGAWSNIYNSVLTSISTPLKAGFGNTALMLAKPLSVIGGAALSGDIKAIKRGWYQYSAFADTFKRGLSHMSMVYRKAAQDPTSVGYIVRDDIAVKNEKTMDVLRSFAESAEKAGESGPMVLYNQAEALNDLSNHPWFRFGANAMTAFDGFTRAVLGAAEARGRAWDKFVDGGRTLDAKSLKDAEQEIYEEMFDKSGMITDSAVDHASREIALNLDNPAVKNISAFVDRNKFMKPFLMFPRTSANMISMMNKFSPVSLFMKDYNRLAMPGVNFTGEEIAEILQSKGIKVTGVPEVDGQAFQRLRHEIRGRKAIGTVSVMGAAGLFMNDSLHGNGHFDKERQKVRRDLNWKPKSYKAWDGKWYSYEWLGPLGDWLALTADVMDNFDSITEADLETNINKMGFILAANLTDKSMLAGLEPMNDVLRGNPAAMNRWAASFVSSLAPFSGARNEFGRLISPQLREVDMELGQLLRNRNKYLDELDPQNALPNKYDWIDGKLIGYTDNFFVRGWNAFFPMKVSDEISEERQFLLDIEYDSRPLFNSNGKGVKYTPSERSELYSLMGQDQFFKRDLKRIMKSTEASQWRAAIKEARRSGRQVDPKLWDALYLRIDRSLLKAKRAAEIKLSNREEIKVRQYEAQINKYDQQRGNAPRFPLTNK